MTKGPFQHLTIVDFSQLRAGPYCTRLLAGLGARVLKIEPPGEGDPLRLQGPFKDGKRNIEGCLPFHWLNAGKLSVALDLADPASGAAVDALIRAADVILEDFGPSRAGALGLDYARVSSVNPAAILVSLSPFGQDGPYANYVADDAVIYAMSGGMVATGAPDRPPLHSGPAIAEYTAGLHAYIAAMMALFRRRDVGEHVDLSMQESALENVEIHLAEFAADGKVARRNGDEHPLVPWRSYPCRDGHVAIIGGPQRHWHKAAAMFEEPRLAAPDLAHMKGRVERRREVEGLFRPWLLRHDKQGIYHKGQALGLAFGYLATLGDVLASPQLKARGFFRQSDDHPMVGRLTVAGPPFRLDGVDWVHGRAPLLGEHTNAVTDGSAGGATRRSAPASNGKRSGATAAQPLAGVNVIDMCHEWAGPHAGRLLADFGATVIKVEYLRRLDHMRGGRKDNKAYDRTARFLQLNRNKRSVTLDLKAARDRALFEDLVRRSDVVLSNSRPRVLDRLGYGYQSLKALKGDIILASLSACGQTGPESSYAGYGGGLEATCGVQSLTAYDRDGEPRRIREMDVTNGIMGAVAIMTALVRRRFSGQGGWVDLSEIEAPAHALAGEHLLEYATNGVCSLPIGNRHLCHVPHGCYPCSGTDAWVVISVADEAQWSALARLIGRTEWSSDARFSSPDGRRTGHGEIDDSIAAWTRRRDKYSALMELQSVGVPAGAVLNAADLHADAHLAARDYFRRPTQQPDAPVHSGFPFRLSGGGGKVQRSGPALGEGNREIVSEFLGHPVSEVPVFAEDDVVTDFDLVPIDERP